MEKLIPVTELPVAGFKFAFWCYFLAIELLDLADIRLRDINPANLGSIEKDGCLYPMIIDFDLASPTGRKEDEHAISNRRAGTLPFVAVGLLQNPDCAHYLRFDSESLLWCATWIACCNKRSHSLGEHPFLEWFNPSSSLPIIAAAKTGTNVGFRLRKAHLPILPEYEETRDGLFDLLVAFGKGYDNDERRRQMDILRVPYVMEQGTPRALRAQLEQSKFWTIPTPENRWISP